MPPPPATLGESLDLLEAYLVRERFRGYDPYDVLASPLFDLPVLRSSRWPRFAAQQAFRRLPLNVRPLLGIPKSQNPVTLAFVLEGSAYRALADHERADRHRERALECVRQLTQLRVQGYSGACWAYPFDWEARYARVPAGIPTVVATGLVTNALFVAHSLLQLEQALDMCESATRFVLDDLPRAIENDAFCWGYFPGDRQRVLNATMLGARLCAQVYSAAGRTRLRDAAGATALYVARRQREDGSWPYAIGDSRQWTDNFHTGYVLDAFDSYARRTGDDQFQAATGKGWEYYRTAFFRDGAIPRYFPSRPFPVDASACAQSLLTLARFGDLSTARAVADWTIANLQCADGHFAYRLGRLGLVRIPYIRWSSAYMYAGLSRLAYALTGGAPV